MKNLSEMNLLKSYKSESAATPATQAVPQSERLGNDYDGNEGAEGVAHERIERILKQLTIPEDYDKKTQIDALIKECLSEINGIRASFQHDMINKLRTQHQTGTARDADSKSQILSNTECLLQKKCSRGCQHCNYTYNTRNAQNVRTCPEYQSQKITASDNFTHAMPESRLSSSSKNIMKPVEFLQPYDVYSRKRQQPTKRCPSNPHNSPEINYHCNKPQFRPDCTHSGNHLSVYEPNEPKKSRESDHNPLHMQLYESSKPKRSSELRRSREFDHNINNNPISSPYAGSEPRRSRESDYNLNSNPMSPFDSSEPRRSRESDYNLSFNQLSLYDAMSDSKSVGEQRLSAEARKSRESDYTINHMLSNEASETNRIGQPGRFCEPRKSREPQYNLNHKYLCVREPKEPKRLGESRISRDYSHSRHHLTLKKSNDSKRFSEPRRSREFRRSRDSDHKFSHNHYSRKSQEPRVFIDSKELREHSKTREQKISFQKQRNMIKESKISRETKPYKDPRKRSEELVKPLKPFRDPRKRSVELVKPNALTFKSNKERIDFRDSKVSKGAKSPMYFPKEGRDLANRKSNPYKVAKISPEMVKVIISNFNTMDNRISGLEHSICMLQATIENMDVFKDNSKKQGQIIRKFIKKEIRMLKLTEDRMALGEKRWKS